MKHSFNVSVEMYFLRASFNFSIAVFNFNVSLHFIRAQDYILNNIVFRILAACIPFAFFTGAKENCTKKNNHINNIVIQSIILQP